MPLQYIFHLSDLHIRNGDKLYCRYDEYNNVFDNTIKSLKDTIDKNKFDFDDYITIITGDVFHNKNNIGNYGLMLYKTFIQNLLKFTRVYVLPGNHDIIQSDTNQPSLVNSSTFDLTNLTILNETQTFIIDDIGFSYVSVEQTLDNYKNSGRFQDLPTFPEINEKVKYKIALFHGSFVSAKLYNGDDIKIEYNPYPLEWIKDFDYVLLGDIHKRQVFTYKNKTICGYSGSLIQQNFGEDIIEHGYLLWNLNEKKVKELNVYNNIGLINIKQNENEEIVIRKNGKYEYLLKTEIENNLDYFPKKIEIKTFSKINFENLNNLLKKHNIHFTIISNFNERSLNLDSSNDYNLVDDIYDKNEVDNIINNDYILTYFSKLLSTDKQNKLNEIIKNKELLLFDVNKYPDDLTDECIKRNKDINTLIISCNKTDDVKQLKHPFTIKYLEWEGLLCYENKNWINMHELDTKTFMIKGKNGTGKSSIYNILLLSIWGKLQDDPKMFINFINCNKTRGYTIIDIETNGILYRIKKDFYLKNDKTDKTSKSDTSNCKKTHLYKIIDNNELLLEAEDSSATDKIKTLFGDGNNFLSSSMITQSVKNDILKLEPKKTLEVIDSSFNIDYIYNLYNLFKTSINKYKDFRKTVENKKQVYEKLVSNCKIEIIDDNEIEKLNTELSLKTNEKDELLLLFDNIKIDIKNPKNLIILETDYIGLINLLDKSKIIDNNEELEDLKQQYNELKFKLKDEKDLLLLKNAFNSDIENYFKINKLIVKPCELSLLENEKIQLVKYFDTYNKNKSNGDNIDLSELEQSLTSLYNNQLLLETKEKELILIKPIKIDNCDLNKDELMEQIIEMFGSLENFKLYISNNPKLSVIINKTHLINKNVSLNDYNTYKQQYNELSYLLKDTNIKIDSDYNPKLDEEKLKTMVVKIKPCEFSVLENEKIQLNMYLDLYHKNENENKKRNKKGNKDDIILIDLEKSLILLQNNLLELEQKEKELIDNKPNKITNSSINKDELLNEIIKMYDSLDIFKEFILSLNLNSNVSIPNNSNNKNNNSLSYNDYKLLLKQKIKLEELINLNKNKLSTLESEFNLLFKKQQNTIVKNKPLNPLNQIKLKTSIAVNKEIKLINIDDILKQIENDEKEIDNYNIISDKIHNLHILLDTYKNELLLLNTNEEYKYDPKCKYCCKRPWVCRINELELNISKINDDLLHYYSLITIEDINSFIEKNETNKKIKYNYDLLKEWFDYYKSKEQYDKLNKELNKIITDKNDLYKLNEKNIDEINDIIINIDIFNNYSYILYDKLNTVEQFEIYKSWDFIYNQLILNIIDLKKTISKTEDDINYYKIIKPRILNYYQLSDLYNQWFEYDTTLKILQSYQLLQITEIIHNYEYYNYYSYLLFDKLNTIQHFEIYKSWEFNYNEIITNINSSKLNIKNTEEDINYFKNIKPRIDKYFELYDLFNKWLVFDHNTKISNTYHLFKLKDILDTTDKFIEYNTNNNIKPFIKEKLDLYELIKIKERDIKIINDKIIKLTTINSYNNDNKASYNKLFDIILDLDITIDMLETVIINFQAFKIELYEKYVLNRLTDKTNKIIKSLCHKDTKPFKLDYNLDVSKDYININWLISINNDNDNDNKQTITINRASGFQHFVISMALRIALFMNNYEVQCNQLFIDEGFVNFDKYNLSIVPSFLKSLLSYFKSVIIVSHIDLIQDNVDEIIEIDYNKLTSVSNMHYGLTKHLIVKRNRK